MSCPAGTIAFSFDGTNAQAIAWAHVRAAELITSIEEDARQSVREVMERAFVEGIAPRDAARLIFDIVGMLPRDANAVMNRQSELIADGASQAEAAAAAAEYADELHAARAMMIARTETMAASNEGQQQLWDQAIEAGDLDPAGMFKVWIVADPCEECAVYEDEEVPVQEDFAEGNPPLHPNCRCTIGLVGE